MHTRETFNAQEIQVAMEVLDQALDHPETGDYQVLCAEKDAALAGYICFGPVPMTDRRFDLYWIAVDPVFSGQGIGLVLLQKMEAVLMDQGPCRVYIDTSSTLPYAPARAFYERNGFKCVCTLADFYRPDDDKLILMKELVP